MRKIAIIILLALAVPAALHAQRTARGSWFVGADGVFTFTSFGGQITFGKYLLRSYAGGGVNAAFRAVSQNTGTVSYKLAYGQYTATGEFMYRLCAARSRWFNLYGGGGALLGVEVYDPLDQRPEGVILSETGATFIYGLDARLEAEFYAFRSFAFTVGGRLPVTFGSLCRVFNYEVSAGVRVNF